MGQEGDRRLPPGDVLVGAEHAPQRRLHAEDVEQVVGHVLHVDGAWRRAVPERGGAGPEGRHAGERARLLPPIQEFWLGYGEPIPSGRERQGEHHPVGIPERQGLEHHGIHHAHDGGGRSDAEGDGRERGQREARAAAQLPEPMGEVLNESVDPRRTGRSTAGRLLHGQTLGLQAHRVAEVGPRPRLGFLRREALGDQVVDPVGEVCLELGIHVAVLAQVRRAGLVEGGAPALHTASPDASPMTWPTASTYRFQLRDCAANASRPSGVSA